MVLEGDAVLLALINSGQPEAISYVHEYIASSTPASHTLKALSPYIDTQFLLIILKSMAKHQPSSTRLELGWELEDFVNSIEKPIDIRILSEQLKSSNYKLVLLTLKAINILFQHQRFPPKDFRQSISSYKSVSHHCNTEVALEFIQLLMASANDTGDLRDLSSLLQNERLDIQLFIADGLGALYGRLPEDVRQSEDMQNAILATQRLDTRIATKAASSLINCPNFDSKVGILLCLIQSPYQSVQDHLIKKLIENRDKKIVHEIRKYRRNNTDARLEQYIATFLEGYYQNYRAVLINKFITAVGYTVVSILLFFRLSFRILAIFVVLLYIIPLWGFSGLPGMVGLLGCISVPFIPLAAGVIAFRFSFVDKEDFLSCSGWISLTLIIAGGVALMLIASNMGLLR